jgi:hypothetical protein
MFRSPAGSLSRISTLTSIALAIGDPLDQGDKSGVSVREVPEKTLLVSDYAETLCSLSATPAGASESHLDAHSCSCEHADQRVDTEQVDLPADKIANPWLSDVEKLGCCALGQFPLPDNSSQLHHQFRSEPQTLGLLGAKAQIPEYISTGLLNFYRHDPFRFSILAAFESARSIAI